MDFWANLRTLIFNHENTKARNGLFFVFYYFRAWVINSFFWLNIKLG